MTKTPEALYLDLLKKTLSFSLWEEPGWPIDRPAEILPLYKSVPIALTSKAFALFKLQIVHSRKVSREERETGQVWPVLADTMVGLKRLDNLQMCVESVIERGVEGDLIETGVWRGGSCIFMRGILAAHQVRDRKVFVADSFDGLPKPNAALYPVDKKDKLHRVRFLAVSQEQVQANFARYGLLDDQVVFLKGWFSETLPTAPIKRLAVLRLDGDMYESTMDALTNLYPKLSSGGFCIIDDYALKSCSKAVHDYRAQNGIDAPMTEIDPIAVYWQKP